MRKRSTFLGLLCITAAIAAAWMLPRSKSARLRPVEIQPEAFRTGAIEFNDVTLEQAINQLSARTRANIVVHWRDIHWYGFERTRRIHMGLGDESLGKAVRLVCLAAQTDEDFDQQRAGLLETFPLALWTVNGVLHVSLENHAARFHMLRIYDVNAFFCEDVWPRPRPYSNDDSSPVDGVVLAIDKIFQPEGHIGIGLEADGLLLIWGTSDDHRQLALLASVWTNERRRLRAGEPPSSKGIELLKQPAPRSEP